MISAPVRAGVPAGGYLWHWSVLPWIPGCVADEDQPKNDQAIPPTEPSPLPRDPGSLFKPVRDMAEGGGWAFEIPIRRGLAHPSQCLL